MKLFSVFTAVLFDTVAPFAGARIEMAWERSGNTRRKSLPSRERGLKSAKHVKKFHRVSSLPSRERGLKSWIQEEYDEAIQVAPFAGARIEIARQRFYSQDNMSLPSRERGLKLMSGNGL